MNEHSGHFGDDVGRLSELTDMIFDQVRKLAKLHEEAILTDEEFADKKAELLSRL